MGYIKKFESFDDDKIINFLIEKERKFGVSFDNYTIEKGEYEWDIVAKTKTDYKGNIPPMKEVRFRMMEFIKWLSMKTKYDFYEFRGYLFNKIMITSNNKEPDVFDSKVLDTVLGQINVWRLALSKVKIMREVISKINLDDIDPRNFLEAAHELGLDDEGIRLLQQEMYNNQA